MPTFTRWLIPVVAAALVFECSPNHPPPTIVCADCEEACHVCAGYSCLVADAGFADPRCGAYVCADDAGCYGSCSGPEQCQPDAVCDGGVCQALRPDGTACLDQGECKSRHCVDGRCCNSACDAPCDRCDLPGAEGSCGPVAASTQGTPSCAPYVCTGPVSCPTSCSGDPGCAAGAYCQGAACVPTLALGQACSRDAMCSAGHCVDGFCCDTACGGACDACNVTGSVGTCAPSAAGSAGAPSCSPFACTGAGAACASTCTADGGCASTHFCSGPTTCAPKRPAGQACAATSECLSGFCVDGVCCGTACTDGCSACNLAGALGTCGVADAGRSGRPSCMPYVCSGASSLCPTTCATNAQCASGQACADAGCFVDGDSDGTANVADCAPADPLRWSTRPCFRDQDVDGVFSTLSAATCAGAACPAGTQGTAGTDCNDLDGGVYQLLTCYGGPDVDGDGYHPDAGVSTCSGSQCPAGTSSLKDCYDGNANARPGQFLSFDVHRGDGSFDYDCDGLGTQEPGWTCQTTFPTPLAGCTAVPFTGANTNRGYVSTPPACGVAGTWRTCAVWSNATCNSPLYYYGACGAGCNTSFDGGSFSVQELSLPMKCR